MSNFTNVTITKKANIYFDGKVTSRTITFADGSKKTLGIMLPGEYTFNTDAAELWKFLPATCRCNCRDRRNGKPMEPEAPSKFRLSRASV